MPSRIPHAFTQEIADHRLARAISKNCCGEKSLELSVCDYLFDEIIEIADTPQLGVKKVIKPDGSVETTEADMIEHRRLRIDARKWAFGENVPAQVRRSAD